MALYWATLNKHLNAPIKSTQQTKTIKCHITSITCTVSEKARVSTEHIRNPTRCTDDRLQTIKGSSTKNNPQGHGISSYHCFNMIGCQTCYPNRTKPDHTIGSRQHPPDTQTLNNIPWETRLKVVCWGSELCPQLPMRS